MSFRLVLKLVTLAVTLRYFNEFGKHTFQLLTTCSSIEHTGQKPDSITHTTVKLVCVTKFTHSRVDTKLPVNRFTLLTFMLKISVRTITTPCCAIQAGCLLYFTVHVRCRRKESSRSLSHLLMSFLCANPTNNPQNACGFSTGMQERVIVTTVSI